MTYSDLEHPDPFGRVLFKEPHHQVQHVSVPICWVLGPGTSARFRFRLDDLEQLNGVLNVERQFASQHAV